MSDTHWLTQIACPKCQGKLTKINDSTGLLCEHDQLVFPILDGIPVMLLEQATSVAHSV